MRTQTTMDTCLSETGIRDRNGMGLARAGRETRCTEKILISVNPADG